MTRENRSLLVVLGVLLVALLTLGPVLIGGMMSPGVMAPGIMGWAYGWGASSAPNGLVWGTGMALSGLMMLVVWGAVIVGIALLVRSATGQFSRRGGLDTSDDGLTILRRRYASGEIDQATFERMRSELGDPVQPTPVNGRSEAIR